MIFGSGKNPRYPYKPRIPFTVFVNPKLKLLDDEGEIELLEGCLSVPGIRGRVRRKAHVTLEAMTPEGEPFAVEAFGHAAGTLQHEHDHIDGSVVGVHCVRATLRFDRRLSSLNTMVTTMATMMTM